MVWIQSKGALGDELGLTGAVRELKRQKPDEMIRLWGRFQPDIWENCPYLNIGNKDSGEKIVCHSYYPQHVGNRTELNFGLLGVDPARAVDVLPEFFWTEEELARPIRVRKTRAPDEKLYLPLEEVIPPDAGRVIAVDPCAGWATRVWPYERFDQLCQELTARGYYVVQAGAQGKRPLLGIKSNVVCRLDIRSLAQWIGRCALFIGNDSGLFHIAAAVGTPQVVVYGLTRKTCGPYPSTTAVYPKTACAPGCFQGCVRRGPDKKIFHCMTEIGVGEVLEAVERALAAPRPPSRLVPALSRAEIYTKFMAAAALAVGA